MKDLQPSGIFAVLVFWVLENLLKYHRLHETARLNESIQTYMHIVHRVKMAKVTKIHLQDSTPSPGSQA